MYKLFWEIIILIELCSAQFSTLEIPENCEYQIIEIYDGPPVNQTCINCLCETFTDCNRGIGCNGYTCGPFRITKTYWQDAGSIKLQNTSSDYKDCLNDYKCSVDTIQGYMSKYGIDCNEDDLVNCYDFALLHYFGKDNCNNALPKYLRDKLNECLIREELF